VGINLPTFLGHGLADFCAAFTIRYRLYPDKIRQRCFFLNQSFGRHVGCSVDRYTRKVPIFLPNLTPYIFQKFQAYGLPREAAMLARSWGSYFCLYVCLSVTRVLCDKMKEHTTDILIPYEKVINLVFCHQQRLVGDVFST